MFPLIVVPLGRAQAFLRGILWTLPATVLGFSVYTAFPRLHFVPSGVSNRVVDYSLALVLLLIAFLGLTLGVRALQWLVLAFWPGSIGVVATHDELTLKLGPFGTRRYPTGELELRYPFELSEEETDGSFESFLPEEQQRALFLPRITHPAEHAPINRTIMRFSSGPESRIATLLGPAIEHWRSLQGRTV